MNEVKIFENDEFGVVRTIVVDNEPWFVASDVCNILELANTTVALHRLDDDERSKFNLGRQGESNCINEYGLYSLVLASRKKSAQKFKRWITHEVLPSIRRIGGYIAGQENMSDDELMAKALLVAQRCIEDKNKIIASQKQIIGELTPKAEYVDIILNNKGLVTITQIAKDYGISGANLNRILADLHVQYKQSGQWLLYSPHQNKGWTHSKTINITRSDGRSDVVMETKWTQKGRLALYELLKHNGILPCVEK